MVNQNNDPNRRLPLPFPQILRPVRQVAQERMNDPPNLVNRNGPPEIMEHLDEEELDGLLHMPPGINENLNNNRPLEPEPGQQPPQDNGYGAPMDVDGGRRRKKLKNRTNKRTTTKKIKKTKKTKKNNKKRRTKRY